MDTGCRGGPKCPESAWERLPDAPVSGRQDVASAVVNGSVYIIGGFSYTSPFAYNDFLRLGPNSPDSAHGKNTYNSVPGAPWTWQHLPPFPHPICMHSVAAIGTKIYVQGGADYNRKLFTNWNDRNGGNHLLGKRLYVFDVAEVELGWLRLPDNPGRPQLVFLHTLPKLHRTCGWGGCTLHWPSHAGRGSARPHHAPTCSVRQPPDCLIARI
jgi:hypothetical protein